MATADPAWDAGTAVTIDDLNRLGGGVDNWLSYVEPIADSGNNYSDNGSYDMFWINDIRYANQKGRGNAVRRGESRKTINARETRMVVESAPKLVHTTDPLVVQGPVAAIPVTNSTSEAFQVTKTFSQTTGTTSSITSTNTNSITASASVTIGPFTVSASGTLTDEQVKASTQDLTKTEETEFPIMVPAHKKVTATMSTSTSTQTFQYEFDTSMRGRLEFEDAALEKGAAGSVNVPQNGASYDDVGKWYRMKDLHSIGAKTSGTTQYLMTVVTSLSSLTVTEEDVPSNSV